jgi:hypothetical protein
MTKQVFFYCWGCQDYNKHHRDDKDYQMKDTNLGESLTDAYQHMMETGHQIQIKYEEYEEQD